MKKCLSMILAFVMMLTMLPMGVLAAEEGNTERDAIIAQACEVFPEYAAMIRGEISSFAFSDDSSEPPRVVYQETRPISETEKMTLARYSNGASVIVDSSQISSYDIKETGSNASNISNGVVFTLSYKLVAASGFESSFPGILYVNNFKATIYTSSYDKIDNTGTISTSSSFYCPSFRKNVVSTQESASGSAYVSYPFQLKATDGGSFSDSLKISVGNNTINVYF